MNFDDIAKQYIKKQNHNWLKIPDRLRRILILSALDPKTIII